MRRTQVLYEIYPQDYALLCPRATEPGVGGSNDALADIVQEWMGLPDRPPRNAKLPQPQGAGVQTAYPVVGRVLVDNLNALVADERAAVQQNALAAAVQAAVQQGAMLPAGLRGRIRVRKLTPDPSPFDEAALAQELQAADPALPLPDPLRERIGLHDGHAISLADGLSVSQTPSYDHQYSTPLPSPADLASAVYYASGASRPGDLRSTARDFARRAALRHVDSGGGGGGDGEGGEGGEDGEGEGGEDGEGKDGEGEGGEGGEDGEGGEERSAKLPKLCEAGPSSAAGGDEHRVCSICLEFIDETGNWPSVGLPCNHSFHDACITDAVRRCSRGSSSFARCPNCRDCITAFYQVDENGARVGDARPVPEAVQALGDAGGVAQAMVAGPIVHAGVARALRELQSELRGAAPSRARRRP